MYLSMCENMVGNGEYEKISIGRVLVSVSTPLKMCGVCATRRPTHGTFSRFPPSFAFNEDCLCDPAKLFVPCPLSPLRSSLLPFLVIHIHPPRPPLCPPGGCRPTHPRTRPPTHPSSRSPIRPSTHPSAHTLGCMALGHRRLPASL